MAIVLHPPILGPDFSLLRCLFQAHTSVSVALPVNADFTLSKISNIDVKDFDPDVYYNTSISRFTPQKVGYYDFSAFLAMTSSAIGSPPFIDVAIAKNGVVKTKGLTNLGTRSTYGSNTYGTQCVVNTLFYMNGSTDYVEVYANSPGGAQNALVGFEGNLVG